MGGSNFLKKPSKTSPDISQKLVMTERGGPQGAKSSVSGRPPPECPPAEFLGLAATLSQPPCRRQGMSGLVTAERALQTPWSETVEGFRGQNQHRKLSYVQPVQHL